MKVFLNSVVAYARKYGASLFCLFVGLTALFGLGGVANAATSPTMIGGSTNGYVPAFDAGPLLTEVVSYIGGIITNYGLPIVGIVLAFAFFGLVASWIGKGIKKAKGMA